jgi:hypothetical protein
LGKHSTLVSSFHPRSQISICGQVKFSVYFVDLFRGGPLRARRKINSSFWRPIHRGQLLNTAATRLHGSSVIHDRVAIATFHHDRDRCATFCSAWLVSDRNAWSRV